MNDIKYVINFDFPQQVEDYVHRIGRTGRASRSGTAISFFTEEDAKNARELITILSEAKQEIDPSLFEMQGRCGECGNDTGNFFTCVWYHIMRSKFRK